MTKKIIFGTTIAITLFTAAFLAVTIPTVQANHGGTIGLCGLGQVWDPFAEPAQCVLPEECTSGLVLDGHCARPGTIPPPPPSDCEVRCEEQFARDRAACDKGDTECFQEALKRFEDCLDACIAPEECTGERIAETVTFHDNYKINKHGGDPTDPTDPLNPGTVMVLLDTTGSGFLCVVHVAANLQCNNDNPPNNGAGNDTPDVVILAGIAGGPLSPVIFSAAEDTGFRGPDETCVFHATVTAAELGHDITDIIVLNSGVNDVELDESVITITGRMTDESVVTPARPGILNCTCDPPILQQLVCLDDCGGSAAKACTEICAASGAEVLKAGCKLVDSCEGKP